jgi:hypothetical protein
MLRIICLTAVLIVAVPGCKKDPIGVSYVIGPKVEIRKEPMRTSAIIANPGRNEKIEILSKQVQDSRIKAEGAMWYKVRYRDLVGFVSYDEEGIRQNISTFEPAAQGAVGIVSATNLRLRETPGLQGNVLKVLPRGTVVDIVAYGSIYQKIEGKQDRWVEVTTSDGKKGFAFAGFLRWGARSNLIEGEKGATLLGDSQSLDSHIEINTDSPEFLSAPGGASVSEKDPSPCGEKSELGLLPRKGDTVKIHESQTADEKTYYHFTITSGGVNFCDGGVTAWIAADQVQLVPDLFTHTIDKDHPQRQLLAEANAMIGGNLNARKAEIKELPNLTGLPNRLFWLVTARSGECNSAYCPSTGLVIEQDGKKFSLLGKMNNPTVEDLDGDGIQEIITTESERASVTSTLYAYKGGTYQRVFQNDSMGQPMSVQGNRITVQEYAQNDWVSREYEYKDGQVTPLQPAQPQP